MRDTEKSRVTDLFNRLLDLLKKEESEIKEHNIEQIERYCSLKMNILREIHECGFVHETIHESPGLLSVIKKIEEVHRSNTDGVEEIKNAVKGEISLLNKGKSAFKAYAAGMHLR